MSSHNRLMAAIAKEPRKAQLRQQERMSWWNGLGWVAALAAIVIGFLFRHQNSDLRQRLADLEASFSKQDKQLLEAEITSGNIDLTG